MNNLNINKELLLKFLHHDATESEKEEVYHWVRSNPNNSKFLDDLIWNHTLTRKRLSGNEWNSTDKSKIFRNGRFGFNRFITFLAASVIGVLFIIGAGIGIKSYFDVPTIYVSSEKGEIKNIMLADGSVVKLGPDSKISYPQKFSSSHREISLDGEAFFKVRHNESAPFVVNTGSSKVTVLGTSFNVRAYSSDHESSATLVDGKVEIQFLNDKGGKLGASEILKPSQKALLNRVNGEYRIDEVNIDEELAWQNKRVVFDNCRFEDIIKQIERLYNVSIVINNPKLKDLRFTGEFEGESVSEIFETFNEWTTLKVVINDGVVDIY